MALVSDDFIFIHIYKTAGNTVRRIIKDKSCIELAGVHADLQFVYDQHKKAKDLETLKNKYVFTVVRHPYDWLISLYNYIKTFNHGETRHAQNGFMPFLIWLTDEAMKRRFRAEQNKYLTQTGFLSIGGKSKPDKTYLNKIVRYENLHEDLNQVLISIGKEPRLKIPHVNATPDKDLTITDEEKQYIYSHFKEDFVNFKYKR